MPADPMTMLSQANLTGVDILVGSNRDEGKRDFRYFIHCRSRLLIVEN